MNFLRLPLLFLCAILSGRAQPTGNEVLFEFYSSCEQEVSLAYLNDLKDSWRLVKMQRDGNRFFVHHPVEKALWYEFVGASNTWYRRDPYNRHVNADHPYLKRGAAALTTHKNLKVTYVPSPHFDYFTLGDGKKIRELETIYTRLTQDILTVLEPGLAPINGKKIRFYGGMFEGTYATSGNAEIIEGGDYPNSHEIIHVLLHAYPHYGPFAEGVAQCLQQSGNQLPLAEANCSLAAKEKYKRVKLWDVLNDFSNHSDYHLAGSFVYYHLFVKAGAREPFVAFLKEFKRGESATFELVLERYERHLGKSLKSAVNEWEKWVSDVKKSSPVYVDWNGP